MAGFGEKLSAIKGKQEAADLKKKQEAEQAAEAARLEREARRSELSAERDTVMAEFAQAEQTANEAREAIAQADAFAAEQGENLDPEAKAEIDAMKVEAGEAQQKFEELKTRLDGLNAEISAFEGSEESQETSAEATTEVSQGEAPTTEETPQVEVEQAQATEQSPNEPVAPNAEEAPKETIEQSEKNNSVVEEAREFLDNQNKYGATGREAVVGFLKERYPDLQPGTEQYSEAWDNLVQGIRFNQFKESAYFQKHGEVTFDQFQGEKDRLTALAEFADRVEDRKNEDLDQANFTVQVKGEKGWETVTVDMDNLDSLDAATKEKFLAGLKNEKDRVSSDRLSTLLEKGFIKPDEAGDFINIERSGDITQSFSPEAIKKLQENPALAKRIQQEVEVAASNVQAYSEKEPDIAAAYFAKILRAGVDSPDVLRTLIRYNLKADGKSILAKRLEETSKFNDPVASNRFTARDLGTFAKAGVISHEQFMAIAKRDIDSRRDHGVEDKGKSPAEYRNTERLLGEAVSEAYTYKKMGLISQEELDSLLAY